MSSPSSALRADAAPGGRARRRRAGRARTGRRRRRRRSATAPSPRPRRHAAATSPSASSARRGPSCHATAASCSKRCGLGTGNSCGMRERATTLPSSSAATAFTDDVPMSIPTVTCSSRHEPDATGRVRERARARRRATGRSCTRSCRRRRRRVPVDRRPPAARSSTIGTSAAMSQSDTIGSIEMSTAPSATSMCCQKSPSPRVPPAPVRTAASSSSPMPDRASYASLGCRTRARCCASSSAATDDTEIG